MSARATTTSFVSIKENKISEIEVKDLEKPIRIEIPLNSEVKNAENTRCMYLNEQLGKWEVLDSQCEEAVQTGQITMTCCSTHLTTFTVQEVAYVEGYE